MNKKEEQQFYSDVEQLLRQVNKTLKSIGFNHPRYAELCDAAVDVEAYFESNDPQQMGWVGQNGLP